MVDIWSLLGALAQAQTGRPSIGASVKRAPEMARGISDAIGLPSSFGRTAQIGMRAAPVALIPGLRGISSRRSGTAKEQLGGNFDYGKYRNRSTSSPGMGQPTRPTTVQPPPNPLDQLLEIMQGMLGQQAPSYEPNYDDLMAQIEGQVNPVYDARASAIEQLMGRATERIGSGREDVEAMYNQLSQDYGQDAIAAAEQMEQARAEAEALQGTLRKNIKGTYSRVSEEQADLFKKLGIEEAAPEVLGEQASDQAFLESLAETRGTASQDYFNQLGAADQAYYAQGAPLAKLEGSNRSADLLAQLEDYMAQSQAGLTELEGQRTSDIMSAFNQLAMQAQQFAQQQSADAPQQQWGRLMDMFGILQPMYGPQQSQDMLGTQSQVIATQMGLAPQENAQFQNAIAEIGTNPAMLYGQVTNPETGEQVPTNRAQVMQVIREYARQKGLSGRVENALAIWAEQVYK